MSRNSVDEQLFDVVNFKIVDEYTLCIQFSDSTKQTINFKPILLGPLFGPLQDQELFNQVTLDQEIGTLIWPTGADIDPNVLHDWPNHVEAIIKRRTKQFAPA